MIDHLDSGFAFFFFFFDAKFVLIDVLVNTEKIITESYGYFIEFFPQKM